MKVIAWFAAVDQVVVDRCSFRHLKTGGAKEVEEEVALKNHLTTQHGWDHDEYVGHAVFAQFPFNRHRQFKFAFACSIPSHTRSFSL